jgi:hypothetical protein
MNLNFDFDIAKEFSITWDAVFLKLRNEFFDLRDLRVES